MAGIDFVTLEVPDAAVAEAFYKTAFDLDDIVRVRESGEPTTGFRGFTLSLVVSQPSTVDSLVGTALEAGATPLKPVSKSFWGYGGSLQAPDGAIWKVATSSKKETGPATPAEGPVIGKVQRTEPSAALTATNLPFTPKEKYVPKTITLLSGDTVGTSGKLLPATPSASHRF